MLVAIDGPAGAGKSTVAQAVARRLGFTYLDSGAMYRCVALLSLERPDVRPGELARTARIEFCDDHEASDAGLRAREGSSFGDAAQRPRTILDGRDVSERIRSPEVSEVASRVARDPGVREALVAKQRALITVGDWVAEGRDIGTVVAPRAELKVYLTATPEARARRRAAELGIDPADVLTEQSLRDERDSTRRHGPLQAAPGATVLDTTGMSIERVVARIAELAHELADDV